VLTAPRKIEIQETEVEPGPGQVLVKVAACGLCNWEQNHWKGLLGQCPQTLGHEWGGTVAAVGPGVTILGPGDVVTGLPESLTGFADYVVASAGMCAKLPAGFPADHALGEPLKCIVTVLRGTAPESGDVGVVLGCGPMGLWCIQGMAGRLPAALIAVDVFDHKLALASKFGATHTVNAKKEDAVARIREISNGHMADFVIDGTGAPEILNTAVQYLKERRGRLAMMSTHERVCREFDWRPVQDKGITIMGTHPPFSEDEPEDFRRMALLLANGTFRMEEVITHRFALADIQEAFETLENKPDDYLKGVVVP